MNFYNHNMYEWLIMFNLYDLFIPAIIILEFILLNFLLREDGQMNAIEKQLI